MNVGKPVTHLSGHYPFLVFVMFFFHTAPSHCLSLVNFCKHFLTTEYIGVPYLFAILDLSVSQKKLLVVPLEMTDFKLSRLVLIGISV